MLEQATTLTVKAASARQAIVIEDRGSESLEDDVRVEEEEHVKRERGRDSPTSVATFQASPNDKNKSHFIQRTDKAIQTEFLLSETLEAHPEEAAARSVGPKSDANPVSIQQEDYDSGKAFVYSGEQDEVHQQLQSAPAGSEATSQDLLLSRTPNVASIEPRHESTIEEPFGCPAYPEEEVQEGALDAPVVAPLV